jgi:hypothetical protein
MSRLPSGIGLVVGVCALALPVTARTKAVTGAESCFIVKGSEEFVADILRRASRALPSGCRIPYVGVQISQDRPSFKKSPPMLAHQWANGKT